MIKPDQVWEAPCTHTADPIWYIWRCLSFRHIQNVFLDNAVAELKFVATGVIFLQKMTQNFYVLLE